MDNKNVSPEELALENEAVQEAKEDEVRSKVIADYGFDETTDGEKIDRLVQEKLESHKKLSQAIGQKRKIRGERDALLTKPPKEDKSEKETFSLKDTVTLGKLHEDDVDKVVEAAKLLKLPISEAAKHDVVKAMLADSAEKRKTAEATNVDGSRPTKIKADGNALLEGLKKGEIPEAGTKEAEDLYWAKRGGRRS